MVCGFGGSNSNSELRPVHEGGHSNWRSSRPTQKDETLRGRAISFDPSINCHLQLHLCSRNVNAKKRPPSQPLLIPLETSLSPWLSSALRLTHAWTRSLTCRPRSHGNIITRTFISRLNSICLLHKRRSMPIRAAGGQACRIVFRTFGKPPHQRRIRSHSHTQHQRRIRSHSHNKHQRRIRSHLISQGRAAARAADADPVPAVAPGDGSPSTVAVNPFLQFETELFKEE